MLIDVAEAQAVRLGAMCACDKGVENIVFEVGSQIVYFALMRKALDLSYFEGIVSDILEVCKGFDSVSFSLVRKTDNLVAHTLSRFAFNCQTLYFSSSDPKMVVNLFEVDSLAYD